MVSRSRCCFATKLREEQKFALFHRLEEQIGLRCPGGGAWIRAATIQLPSTLLKRRGTQGLMSDYKHTLNLPETEFPDAWRSGQAQPNMLKRWYDQDLYGAIRRAKAGKPSFHFARDGPPTRTAAFTSVTRSTRSSKTSSSESKTSRLRFPYVPGWDCHGLPIELKVEGVVGKPGRRFPPPSSAECRKYPRPRSSARPDFIRLGRAG